jgi:hypothetical protein
LWDGWRHDNIRNYLSRGNDNRTRRKVEPSDVAKKNNAETVAKKFWKLAYSDTIKNSPQPNWPTWDMQGLKPCPFNSSATPKYRSRLRSLDARDVQSDQPGTFR